MAFFGPPIHHLPEESRIIFSEFSERSLLTDSGTT